MTLAPTAARPARIASPPQADWTILMYQAGDNNLRSCLVQNLVDCQQVGSSPSLNLVSQLDRGNKVGCNRYFVEKSDAVNISSPVVQKMGQVDMADPKTLADFVEWGMKTYPARHVMLVISDHGNAWKGAIADDSAHSFMSLPNLQKGLQMAQDATGRKLDVLGFDACLMANAEVAAQLKGLASYMVASEETEGANGWPYNRLLSTDLLRHLQAATREGATPQDLARRIVTQAQADQGMLPTMSAFDMSQVDGLTASVKSLSDSLEASKPADLAQTAAATQKFDDTSDLGDLAGRLLTSPDPSVAEAATQVQAAIGKLVIAEQHSDEYPGAHGVSINLTGGTPPPDYPGLALPQATGWDKVLTQMGQASPA